MPALDASEKMSVRTISKTSRASSCAVASRVETSATKVAARRSLPIRSMAVTLAVAAKRASSSTLFRGRQAETETSMAKLRMSSTLRKARTSSGALRRVGPVGSRPTKCVQPAIQAKLNGPDRKVLIPVTGADLRRMFPTLLARTILCVAGRIVDRQLTRNIIYDARRNTLQVLQKCAQNAQCRAAEQIPSG